ncbi:MAG: hypothetical protein ACRD4O_20210, partial [Bryobacteraceae bacterium]
MATPAQIAANQNNAQLSTGPKSAESKRISSHNAVKTALTGATVLLPSDDAGAYERHISATFSEWNPETNREQVLVQSIADTEWRLLRIPSLESAIYALGRIRFVEQFADQPEAVRPALLDAYIFQTSRRDLMNLNLQQSRLGRRREKDIAELKEIQKERVARREARLNAAAHMCERFKKNGDPFDPAEFGFEFSFDEIERCLGLWEGHRIHCQYP